MSSNELPPGVEVVEQTIVKFVIPKEKLDSLPKEYKDKLLSFLEPELDPISVALTRYSIDEAQVISDQLDWPSGDHMKKDANGNWVSYEAAKKIIDTLISHLPSKITALINDYFT